LIAPFDIFFCQQEVNWIYNYIPKAQQVTGVPEKAIFRSLTLYNKNFIYICNYVPHLSGVHRGRDRMIVLDAYLNLCCEFKSRS